MPLFKKKENEEKKEEMPISFESLLEKDTKKVEEEVPVEASKELNEEKVLLPEYMLNDPELVGFTDLESQLSFYKLATDGLPLLDEGLSVFDMGCGRGDFYDYLKNNVNPNIKYFGVDTKNQIIQVSKQKYGDEINTQVLNWFDADGEYDWVFNNMSTILNYGYDVDRYVYLKNTIDKGMSLSKFGMVLTLLSDNSGVDSYIDFRVSKVIELIEGRFLFGVDQSTNSNIYKLVIFR
jgi:SAM-dependent methyltransferase